MGTVLYDLGKGEFARVYGRRVLFGRRTEHVDVLGTGIEAILYLPKVRVSVLGFYESHESVVPGIPLMGWCVRVWRPYRTTSEGNVDPVNPYLMDGYRP